MVRAGGLFILIVGVAILAGALLPSKRSFLLILGFIVAPPVICARRLRYFRCVLREIVDSMLTL